MKKFEMNFKLVLTSQIISLIGGNILRFALLLFILDLTQSAATFGLVTAVSQLTIMLFSIPGGIMADRLNKKKLIVFFDSIKTIICAVLLVIFLTNTYSVMNLTLLIIIFTAIKTLFGPVLTAATPSIVNQDILVEANGAMQSIQAMSQFLSFVLGGILVATIGMMNIIILAGIAFLTSTVIDLFIKIEHVSKYAQFGIIKTATFDLKKSLRYVTKENTFIFKLALLSSILSLLFLPILTVALPYIMRVEFEASDAMFGISQAISACGIFLGGVLSGKFKKWLDIKYLSYLILVMALLCLVLAIAVYTPLFSVMLIPFWLFNSGLMLIMICITFTNITLSSLIQRQVPIQYLGKISGLFITIANLMTPVGQYAFGLSMELFNEGLATLFIALAVLTIGLAVVVKKCFKQI